MRRADVNLSHREPVPCLKVELVHGLNDCLGENDVRVLTVELRLREEFINTEADHPPIIFP